MNVVNKKVVIVGDGMSGKTSLILSFTKDQFYEDLKPTALGRQNVELEVKGCRVNLEMWDTSGQADYDRLRPTVYPDMDVAIVCFSLHMPDSLENVVTKWVPELRYFCPYAPILLVGNKKDLRSLPDGSAGSSDQSSPNRPVLPTEGEEVAKKIKAADYLECSAKTKEGVREVFEAATKAALKSGQSGGCCSVM